MSLSPAPVEGVPHVTYRSYVDRGVLGYQRCESCATAVFPPRSRCPFCGAHALAWRKSDGRGTVHALTQITPRSSAPYAVVLVDLDDGFRMMSRVNGVDERPVAIDDRVRVSFVDVDGESQPFMVAEGGVA